jgi:glutamate racemase
MPVIGVIEPGAQAACVASLSGHIAVIATEGTVLGGAYQEAIIRLRPDARVSAEPAPLFVALAEEGLSEGRIANDVARHYLSPLFAPSKTSSPSKTGARAAKPIPDTLVLGCTHFPMLIRAIRQAVGPDVRIVDSAATTAASVRRQLAAAGLVNSDGSGKAGGMARVGGWVNAGASTNAVGASSNAAGVSTNGDVRFLATDGRERFALIGSRFLERHIAADEVELVDL